MGHSPQKNSQYYFSRHLRDVLADIPSYGLTVIEAPSGFGKTTALREYLAREQKEADVRWYTCLGETAGRSWAGICRLFGSRKSREGSTEGNAKDSISDELQELGEPSCENMADIACLISGYSPAWPTFAVIDNYQLFDSPVRKRCIAAFSACMHENLHVILVTQPLKDEGAGPTVHAQPYHRIRMRDLLFDAQCISSYCRQAGIELSREETERLQASTGGWVAAIRLQLQNYRHTGSFADFSDISPLVETAIWNRMSRDERNLLMALSLPESFTASQAAIMNDGMALPDTVAELLSLDFFIRYASDRQGYVLHSILQDYLRERFAMQPCEFKKAMYRRAAHASLAAGDLLQAALFFMKVDDYQSVLSLPMTTQYVYNNQERDITSLFESVMDRCPQDILGQHPVFLVLMAYNFFRSGARAYFKHATEAISRLLEKCPADFSPEWERACGEYAMLMSFTEYNDIARMGEFHRKAMQHLRAVSGIPRSEVFRGNMPFGTVSVLCLYWNKLGGLSHLTDLMDTYLPVYSELASGHGAGAEHIFRAEAALASGDDKTAELMAYRATYRARREGQYGVILSADLVLAEVAILRGDAEACETARESIVHNIRESGQRSVLRLGELCQAALDLGLGAAADIPPWLCDISGIRRVVYTHSIPYALILYEHYLLLAGRLAELRRCEELIAQQARTMNYILPKLYHTLYLAAADAKEGAMREACTRMKEALDLALPDKMYLPFARLFSELKPVFAHMELPEEALGLRELCLRRERGVQRIRKQQDGASVLTVREREVLVLARERLTAKEIAAKLSISVHTVNTILKNIYRKLDISRKTELSSVRLP